MSRTITGGLSYRKQYAIYCLLNNISTRARDNCYEMGDGDQVVKHIMRICLTPLPPETEMQMGKSYVYNSPEYKAIRKSRAQHKRQRDLIAALKSSGSWDSWVYFYEHGTYVGFEHKEKTA